MPNFADISAGKHHYKWQGGAFEPQFPSTSIIDFSVPLQTLPHNEEWAPFSLSSPVHVYE
jgi:hypothetical protein